jgi:hypothetical protein
MPPCDAPYLVEYLFEIGPTMAAGMGNGPLTHGEIASWQNNTGIDLNAWETRTLKRLSLDYLGESQRATARDAMPPWDECPYGRPIMRSAEEEMRLSIRKLAEL